ncbi:MAG TPA: CcoQ/FixQ family Cbb3-type cytochrome c oxidase assembly chaperone [Gammaproteobacteria bacterium]|nr:CcoQ/FixQ family Cbb3-type cytochrome c oxidase assembly chaperone [Gammaproteobacteria bacterium]
MGVSLVHSVFTVILVILFVGLVVWAWRKERRTDFQEAAGIVLTEDIWLHQQDEERDTHNE